ncbi:NAD(P)-dependent dehydrogenase, short-chain alcohol dehydrogenase family [Eubacterium aggregans]|uniref:NAD(P)-dependent dehydrogenase, short-chain alcohol dehydrogenase family n=1 Tax=Eubacterium aggregans TaxID=81409 RepID=A0A1H4AQV4_9FIRM|nr:SDR family oxidoreductase [Eubacterium aggregans]SEA38293.1 NAD(P)-dependent dehydrogenase, short-chain alcohol dehydrogenase family [Eubacterium aggregans]
MKLKNKVAIITGGTKGIGYGIAEEYLKEGAKVIITGRDEATGEEAAATLKKIAPDVKFVQGDVSSLKDLQASVDAAVEAFGRLDIYVANAGINDPNKTHFLDITEESYDRIMDINFKGMFFGGQMAARQMAKQGDGGAIINMSSVNAYLALDSQMVYTSSKGAISQFTKVQAVALNPYGIKVNAMAPGPIETELMRRVGSDPQLFNTVISRTPQGRIGTPNECGRLAVFLANEDSNFIFGQTIYIDGGRGFQAFPTPGYKTLTDDEYDAYMKMKKECAHER